MAIWNSLRFLSRAQGGGNKVRRRSNREQGHSRKILKPRGLRIEQCEVRMLLSIGTWVPEGPAPINGGQTQGLTPGDEVTGAIEAVVADPNYADVVYVGTVNGGIWKTSNATAASPTWKHLTDDVSSLSIGALAFDPTDTDTDPDKQSLIAGVGRWSSLNREGGKLSGLLLSSDGGTTWTEADGGGLLVGKDISGIAERGSVILISVDTTESGVLADMGIFRSTDGGNTITQVSQSSGYINGLPGGKSDDLAADPTDNNVFYTSIVGADTFGGSNGIYKSSDMGVTWTKVSSPEMDDLLLSSGASVTSNVKISVGKNDNVYVGIVDGPDAANQQLVGVFRSGNGGDSWTQMDLPAAGGVGIHPNGEGDLDFSLCADPTNANIVYVGGDAQPTTGTARLFRGDASKAAGAQWTALTGLSSPHSGSRDMTFDAGNNLLEVDEGGIYRRTSPSTTTGSWSSINSNLQIAEITNIAYDSVSHVIVAAAQDTGTSEQIPPYSPTATPPTIPWRQVNQGAGGSVAVATNDPGLFGKNQSYRYTSAEYLRGFSKRLVDFENKVISTVSPALVVKGTGGATFQQVDGGQFNTPVVLNSIDPSHMVIGGKNSVFESTDRGETLTNLGAVPLANAMVYGGRQRSVANPNVLVDNLNVLWVASDSGVYVRTGTGALVKTAYAGGAALDIVTDSTDWSKAYVIDDSHVWYTANTGATWINITGATFKPTGLRSLTFVPSGKTGAVVVGGPHGVFASQTGQQGTWRKLGANLPNAPVYDLQYNSKDNVMVAGTLGRGAWQLTNAVKEIFGVPELITVVWTTDEQKDYSLQDKPFEVTPRELTLRFNENQIIDASTLGNLAAPSGIIVTCAGPNGTFYDPTATPAQVNDDTIVPLGWIGLSDNSNEVILRFAQTLGDGFYRITVVGKSNYVFNGVRIPPLLNTAGVAFMDGQNLPPERGSFELRLGPQVSAVVPQPVVRDSSFNLTLTKLPVPRDQFVIDPHTNGADGKPLSATTFEFTTGATSDPTNPNLVAISLATKPGSNTDAKKIEDIAQTIGTVVSNTFPNLTVTVTLNVLKLDYTNQPKSLVLTLSKMTTGALTLQDASGPSGLTPARDTIEVYFTGAMKDSPTWKTDPGSGFVRDPQLYQLLATQETADPTDDIVFIPDHVDYDSATFKATLVFAKPLDQLVTEAAKKFDIVPGTKATGSFRLRVGDKYQQLVSSVPIDPLVDPLVDPLINTVATNTTTFVPPSTPLDTFLLATSIPLTTTTAQSVVIPWQISSASWYTNAWPGYYDEPGHRWLPSNQKLHEGEDHALGADTSGAAAMAYYGFPDVYGSVGGNILHNAITEPQKQRTREIFELYGRYLGIQFAESNTGGLSIVTGDVRALDPGVPGGPTGVGGIAGMGMAIMNSGIPWGNSEFGDRWFQVAMHEIGHLLGYAHSADTPPLTIMDGGGETTGPDLTNEPIFPGDTDIMHGQLLWRPDSNTVNLYKFQLDQPGTVDFETVAQRLPLTSLLNTVITVYDSYKNVVARNDDYYGKDSFVNLHLKEGTYYVAVSAAGNDDFNPEVANSGLGGTTWGAYQLRLNFDPDRTDYLVNTNGTSLDGDANGKPGGVYNYWFNVQPGDPVLPADPPSRTIFVDKAAAGTTHDGTLAHPYTTISAAMAAAALMNPADGNEVVVRVLGNMAFNDNPAIPASLQDNVPYEIGKSSLGVILADGEKLEVPKGVTLLIDAGAVVKLQGADIDVGSSAQGLDRSLGSLQVLGTPQNRVYFTSEKDQTVGRDTDLLQTVPGKGDWGGLVFRNKQDYLSGRTVREDDGIFLNYVNHADIRFGGGKVKVTGTAETAYAPIYTVKSRPTVTFSWITSTADAAMSADPNSFQESEFQSSVYTADYGRVGPELHGNLLSDNGLNGILVRIDVQNNPASPDYGKPLDKLEVSARFDDLDIVHVISGNLVIAGSPGGPVDAGSTCPLLAAPNHGIEVPVWEAKPISLQLKDGQTFTINDGTKTVTFEFDLDGNGVATGNRQVIYSLAVPADLIFTYDEALADATTIATAVADAINLAKVEVGLNATATSNGVMVDIAGPTIFLGGLINPQTRMNGRLAIDPGAVVKLNGGRIEAEMEAQLIAEGTAGFPVVFTSLFDDRYGTGGTFDTGNDGTTRAPIAGDWGGIYFAPFAQGSIDRGRIFYGGGNTAIEGTYANFDPIEIRQAVVRVTNTLFQNNNSGPAGDRNGRGFIGAATIYVRGAQPVIAGNVFRDNVGDAMSINVNALTATLVPDWGRATGINPNELDPEISPVDSFIQYSNNHGPLIRENRMSGNGTNGMLVRGATVDTEVIWDDTDIVHVVKDTITLPNFHTYGGLRIQSSPTESLVVKLMSPKNSTVTAGFVALGTAMEYDDRIGGTLQIVGMPGHPVVLTSLADDSVGAALTPDGVPQFDTDNNPNSKPVPGDWGSITFEKLSNDRNVAVVNEAEPAATIDQDKNASTDGAENLGYLAVSDEGGDETNRLGYEVHGSIRPDAASDADTYKFLAYPNSEVWFDIDRTSFALDTVLELIDGDGKLVAWSNDSDSITETPTDPSLLSSPIDGHGLARPMPRDNWSTDTTDYYGMNPRDAGMRVVLPGYAGNQQVQLPYYIRVRAAVALIQAVRGTQITDHATFTVSNMQPPMGSTTNLNQIVTKFEFWDTTTNLAPASTASHRYIGYKPGDSAAKIADAIQTAIAAAPGLGVTATRIDETLPGSTTLEGEQVSLSGSLVSFQADPESGLRQVNPTGSYQLQIRLRQIQEYPGCTVSGALIAYATTGIQALGTPYNTTLAGETSETTAAAAAGNETVGTAQSVGDLLQSNLEAISLSGYMSGAYDVDTYTMGLHLTAVQKIGGVSDHGTMWPVSFDVDFADGALSRADTSLWVFDSTGKLILIGADSNVIDDQPEATKGASFDDPTRGSSGKMDPFIGPAYLPEGKDYTFALTAQGELPTVLSDPLLRREPINSLQRIAEDHIGPPKDTLSPYNGSSIAQDAEYHLFNWDGDTTVYGPSIQQLNLSADPLNLTDVVLYANSHNDLFTADPLTGLGETDVTNYNVTAAWGINDIAMRDDGELYAITGAGTGKSLYVRLDTGNATNLVTQKNLGITTHEMNTNGTSLQSYPEGLTFQALTEAHVTGQQQRFTWAVGNIGAESGGLSPDGAPYTHNLLYALAEDGTAIQYPDQTRVVDDQGNYTLTGLYADASARLGTNIVPFANIATGPRITGTNGIPAATKTTPSYSTSANDDINDGDTFSLNSDSGPKTFEFDCGQDFRLNQSGVNGAKDIRDQGTVQVNVNGTIHKFEFDSGRVLNVGSGADIAAVGNLPATLAKFQITGLGGAKPYTYVQLPASGPQQIGYNTWDNAATIAASTVAAINRDTGTTGIVASVSVNGTRISLRGDSGLTILNGANPALSIDGEYNAATAPDGGSILFEETDSAATLLASMKAIIESKFSGMPANWVSYADLAGSTAVLPSTYGARLTFQATSATFTAIPISVSFTDAVHFMRQGNTLSGSSSDYGVTAGNIRVPFNASDSGATVAKNMAAAINRANILVSAQPITATVYGKTIELSGAAAIPFSGTPSLPLKFDTQAGAGGDVTGLAIVDSKMWAVDTKGGLYEITSFDPTADPGRARAGVGATWGFVPVDAGGSSTVAGWIPQSAALAVNCVSVSMAGGVGIHFTGLTAGPQNVENGKYKYYVFATDTNGNLYAFDTKAPLSGFRPVFIDGQTTVQLMNPRDAAQTLRAAAGNNIQGLAFSNIDYNLWHATKLRHADPGHGITQTWDDSRIPFLQNVQEGGTSFYFGLQNPNTADSITPQPGAQNYRYSNPTDYDKYNAPGGAFGTLTTNTFSLKGYTSADKPVLYFTYFADTEPGTTWDGAQAYISRDGTNWDIIATNTDWDDTDPIRQDGIGDSLNANNGVKLIADAKWRQARIKLDNYAGVDNLRLRFQFNTASDFQVGTAGLTGSYLLALPGYQLTDGQTFTVDSGATAQTFEFVLGYALDVPSVAGARITDGDSFIVVGPTATKTFTFSTTNASGPNGAAGWWIHYTPQDLPLTVPDSQFTVANNIVAQINASGIGVLPFVQQDADGKGYENLVFLQGAKLGTTIVSGTAVSMTGSSPDRLSANHLLKIVDSTGRVITASATAGQISDLIVNGHQGPDTIWNTFDDIPGANSYYPNAFKQELLPINATTGLIFPAEPTDLRKPNIRIIGHTFSQAGGRFDLPFSAYLDGDNPRHKDALVLDPPKDRFLDIHRGQNNSYEGFYIDDVVIGFAERGEMVTGNFTADATFTAQPLPADLSKRAISVGPYQIEVRRAQEYGYYHITPAPPPFLILTTAYDTNDRMSQNYTIYAPSAGDAIHGQIFKISDGINTVAFQLVDRALTEPGGGIPVYFTAGQNDVALASDICAAINGQTTIKVTATSSTGNRIDLAGATWTDGFPSVQLPTQFGTGAEPNSDGQRHRDQGQLILAGNEVLHSKDYGIVVAPSKLFPSGTYLQSGSVLPLDVNNPGRFLPGVVIENNVLAYNVAGGISISGDADLPNVPLAPVPFARVVNNTIYGNLDQGGAADTGIFVTTNAGPTLLNNIVANLNRGIYIEASSIDVTIAGVRYLRTVVGETVYQNDALKTNITDPNNNQFAINLDPGDALFVNPDPQYANFYLARGSNAIDSSINKLDDRPDLFVVRSPLGLPRSDINAPERDLNGKLRVRDTDQHDAWPGLGANIWKDRGAIERADHTELTAALANPIDGFIDPINSSNPLNDRNPTKDDVRLIAAVLSNFKIQLDDSGGVGIDNTTVTTATVKLFRDGSELTSGIDYFFSYNSVNNLIVLQPATGSWALGSMYTIVMDNSPAGILDLAGNRLLSNRDDNTTQFQIDIRGVDFGDAKMSMADKTTSATELPAGARHLVDTRIHLGANVDTETVPHINDSATGDQFDDGIVFKFDPGNTYLISDSGSTPIMQPIDVTASWDGVLDAWIDWNHDGVWDPTVWNATTNPTGEKLTFKDGPGSGAADVDELHAETKTLYFAIPTKLTSDNTEWFKTFARFRFSTAGGLEPTGEAPDGEVEDYQVSVAPQPATIRGTVWNDLNHDGTFDPNEKGMMTDRWTIYADVNKNQVFDALVDYFTESSVDMDPNVNGSYSLSIPVPGTYKIREVPRDGWKQTCPDLLVPPNDRNDEYTIPVVGEDSNTGNNFGNRDARPTVTIEQAADQAEPATGTSVRFTVTFDTAVGDFAAPGDVSLANSTTPGNLTYTVTPIAPLNGKNYEVTVSGMIGSGTVVAEIPAGVAHDTSTNRNPNMPATWGDTPATDNRIEYRSSPTVTIVRASNQADRTRTEPILFTVVFSQPVSDFDDIVGDVDLSQSDPSVGSLTYTIASADLLGERYTVKVVGMTDSGKVRAGIPANVAQDSTLPLLKNLASPLPNAEVDYDVTVPTVTISAASGSTTVSPIVFTVTFSEPVTDFTRTSVVLSGVAGVTATIPLNGITQVNDRTYTVSVDGMTLHGAVTATIGDGAVHDVVGNANRGIASCTVNYLAAPLTVTIKQAPGQAEPALAGPVYFTVEFSSAVYDFDVGDVTLSDTVGGGLTPAINPTNGDLTHKYYTVAVSVPVTAVSGNIEANILANVASDAFGQFNSHSTTGITPSTDNVVAYKPSLGVIIEQDPTQADPTNNGTIYFIATFNNPVRYFYTSDDVVLSGDANPTKAVITPLDSSRMRYRVAVSGMTHSKGDVVDGKLIKGIVKVDIPANAAVNDGGNGNPPSPSEGYDNIVIYDTNSPTVTVEQASTQADPTSTAEIHFTATFSEPVVDFTPSDVSLKSTAPDTLSCEVNPTHVDGKPDRTIFDVLVKGMKTTSQVVAAINAGVALDDAGNLNRASTSTDNVVNYDITRPKVTINQAATQADPSNLSTVHFTAVFSEQVTDFSASSVSLSGTAGGTTGTLTAVVEPIPGTGGKAYDVAVSGMTVNGTVVATIPAGLVHDLVGNLNEASTKTDNSITYAKPISAKFDFGTASSPIETGYFRVAPSTKFTTKLGYGWKAGTISAADSQLGTALDEDCNYTKDGTFVMNVPKGTYVVSMLLGRNGVASPLKNMVIYVEGKKLATMSTVGYDTVEWTNILDPVVVTDGQLTLRLVSKTPYAAIDSLTITQQVLSLVASPDSGKPSTAKSVTLTDANLKPVVTQAIAQWSALGVSQELLSAMSRVSVLIKDLPGSELGLTSLNTIIIDRNAAGYGWFIDPTPGDSQEFQRSSVDGQLHALDPKAVDRMDLLTVVAHELGHIAGLDDLNASVGSLMNQTLSKGVRRTPGASETDALFANGTLGTGLKTFVGPPSPAKTSGLKPLK